MTATQPATKSRPILMSSPMVKAILDDCKTVTRRVVKGVSLATFVGPPSFDADCIKDWDGGPSRLDIAPDDWEICPYGVPGDTLWVKETFARRLDVDPAEEPEKARRYALYRADGTPLDEPHWHSYPSRWTPSILMPRWASRITLEVVATRVERLSDITEEDAIAEGFRDSANYSAREHFFKLWGEINGKTQPRESNPYVWVISFRRVVPAEAGR